MAGVFQPGVFQPDVFQMFSGMPLPQIDSSRGIEAAFAVHTKPLRRKLPRRIQNMLLKQLAEQAKLDAVTRRMIARAQIELVGQMRRAVDSNAGLMRRVALGAAA